MSARRMRGYSLLEIVVAMAVFGIFLTIVTVLTLEMKRQEKRYPVNFMQHPQVIAVVGRLRRDVQDAYMSDPYLESGFQGYVNGPQILMIKTYVESGAQEVVWDFQKKGEARRISWRVGVKSEWVARGLPPNFNVDIKAIEFPGHPWGTRIQAFDDNGNLAIDQILLPRAHD